MSDKGREFSGILSGSRYHRMSAWLGFNPAFYRKAVMGLEFSSGMQVLDLGCGTAALSAALSEQMDNGSKITGVDLSEGQLCYARQRMENCWVTFEGRRASMDELAFPDETFDLVVTSMAFHEATPQVRRAAIREAGRVLKSGHCFVLVDWGKPRAGLKGVLWLPLLAIGDGRRDNWRNVYPSICEKNGFVLERDEYLNSLVRRQVFRKKNASSCRSE